MATGGGDLGAVPGDDDGLSRAVSIDMDRRAIANGWLRRPDGNGLDPDKIAALIERNLARAMATEDDRALANLTRNVIAVVGQVMEQEKRDAGGENVNVHLTGTAGVDERRSELAQLCAAALERAGVGAGPRPADGEEPGRNGAPKP